MAALVLISLTAASLWMTYGRSGVSMLLRPQQSVELFARLAIIGGLLFYFSSGPGDGAGPAFGDALSALG
jgi:putative oxidoreductase